jgi:hypothetical protein
MVLSRALESAFTGICERRRGGTFSDENMEYLLSIHVHGLKQVIVTLFELKGTIGGELCRLPRHAWNDWRFCSSRRNFPAPWFQIREIGLGELTTIDSFIDFGRQKSIAYERAFPENGSCTSRLTLFLPRIDVFTALHGSRRRPYRSSSVTTKRAGRWARNAVLSPLSFESGPCDSHLGWPRGGSRMPACRGRTVAGSAESPAPGHIFRLGGAAAD